MFAKITAFYRSRNRRERFMLLAMVFFAAAIWFTFLMDKGKKLSAEKEALEQRLASADFIISKGPQIQAELDKISGVIDPAKTYNALALQIAIEECARTADIQYTLSNASTKDAGKFKLHTISINFPKNSLKAFATFENAIAKYEPYITISRVNFDGDGNGGVTARYNVSSFELAK